MSLAHLHCVFDVSMRLAMHCCMCCLSLHTAHFQFSAQSKLVLAPTTRALQMAEAALADEWVINGDRVALQRRVLRLGKPPRRWKRPSWAAAALREPLEVTTYPFVCQPCQLHTHCNPATG